ncbi:hypothetical protein A3850_005695 [Lewinella sp. 4G2]|nr:hypothetical protein A3850_005695 [Lewinella sp. 4G2]
MGLNVALSISNTINWVIPIVSLVVPVRQAMRTINNRDWSLIFVMLAVVCWLVGVLTMASPYFSKEAEATWRNVSQIGMVACMVVAAYLLFLAGRERALGVGALMILYVFIWLGVASWVWMFWLLGSVFG